jgi:type I restriction enzyme S subunit
MNNLKSKTISELVDVFNNIRIPLSSKERENLEKLYPYYGAQNIVDYVDNYLFDGEYILIAEDGENLRSNNQNICNLVNGKFWVNNHAHIVKANSNNITKYLYYNFNRIKFEPYVTGSAQPKLNKENLLNIKTYVHEYLDQQKIAKVLSDLDAKIELNNKINAELEAMAKTLYDYWFVQFDFPNEEGKPYKSSDGKMVWNEELKREIPNEWEVMSIDEYAEVKKGELITAKDAEIGEIKVVAAGIGYSYKHSKANRDRNTITISGSGANAGFINFWREPIFASDCITVRGNSDTETLMLLHHLKFIQAHILSQATGSAQPHVYPSDIKVLNYIVPPMNLIDDFGEIIIPMNDKIAVNQKENQELASLRDWLLPMLMNGQVSVGGTNVSIEEKKKQFKDLLDKFIEYPDHEEKLGIVAEEKVEYKRN